MTSGIKNISALESPSAVFNALLDALDFGQTVDILFDARRAECAVPDHLRAAGGKSFKYSRAFSPPIPDLLATDEGISATLTFNGAPFKTFVPWSAVAFMFFPHDVALRAAATANAPKLRLVADDEAPPEEERPAFAGGGLRLVKGGEA